MKVSPAPWIAECVGSTGGENPDDVYELNNGYSRIAEYLNEGDAKLCAAAPDLLKALRDIEMETRKGGQWTTEEINQLARIVIAKAEGK